MRAPNKNCIARHNSDRPDCVLHRESPESRAQAVPVVSVDPLDLWDPLDWLEPLARLDARYSQNSRITF